MKKISLLLVASAFVFAANAQDAKKDAKAAPAKTEKATPAKSDKAEPAKTDAKTDAKPAKTAKPAKKAEEKK